MPPNNFASVLTAPPKRSLADDIVVRLREAIAGGKLAPGERLQEQLIAESLGVSRGPVREALLVLEREGLVVKQHNKGAVVARLSRQDLDEVFSLRLALERLAMQRAVHQAQPAQLAALQAILDQMAVAAQQGLTAQTSAELDLAFHEVIYQASRHQRLLDAWMNLKPQIHIFLLTRNAANLDYREAIVSSHQALLDALHARVEAAAMRAMDDHLHEAYRRILADYQPGTSAPAA